MARRMVQVIVLSFFWKILTKRFLCDIAVKFIILDDITKDFVEPSIIDIKIGKLTGDPNETKPILEEKIYLSKEDLGLSIPGFKVYRIATGEIMKVGKDYGRKLNSDGVVDALRLFLNADSGISLQMMLQFLAPLWQILLWCSTQKKFRFYSSSILLAYDVRRLKQCLKSGCAIRSLSPFLERDLNISSPSLSFASGLRSCSLTNVACFDHLSSNQNMADGRHSHTPLSSSSPAALTTHGSSNVFSGEDSWQVELENSCQARSYVTSHERDFQPIKQSQKNDWKDGECPENKDEWVKVKMIDFGRAFPSVYDELDTNYLEGIENLVKILGNIVQEARLPMMW